MPVPQETRPGSEALLLCCPICRSDLVDTVGSTGALDGRPDSTLVLLCLACRSVHLGPALAVPSEAARAAIHDATERFCARPGAAHGPGLVRLAFTLETVEDPLGALRQAARSLRAEGRIELLGHHLESLCFRSFRGRHWYAYGAPGARQFLSRDGLARLARDAGLRIVSQRSAPRPDAWRHSLRNWLVDWRRGPLLRFLLAGHWGGPWLASLLLEFGSDLRGRGTLLRTTFEKLDDRP